VGQAGKPVARVGHREAQRRRDLNLGHREVGHSPSKPLHSGGWVADGDRWGGHSPVVVAADGWVVEQAGAQAKQANTEVGLDSGGVAQRWEGAHDGSGRWWGACFGMSFLMT
jgi:hypothetical protein